VYDVDWTVSGKFIEFRAPLDVSNIHKNVWTPAKDGPKDWTPAQPESLSLDPSKTTGPQQRKLNFTGPEQRR